LITAVWGGRIVSDSALTTRRAIGDSGEKQRLIKTLPLKEQSIAIARARLGCRRDKLRDDCQVERALTSARGFAIRPRA
jgi:hypothetical protein